MTSKKIFFAYIPVFHQGWAKFLALDDGGDKKASSKRLVLVTGQQLRPWAPTHKDLHAISADKIKPMLLAIYPDWQIEVMDQTLARELNDKRCELIIPDDTALISYIEQNLPNVKISPQNIWLRWEKEKIVTADEDRASSQKQLEQANSSHCNQTKTDHSENHQSVAPDEVLHPPKCHQALNLANLPPKIQQIITTAQCEGQKSSDWWRQVGAVAVRGQKILLQTHNTHLPHPDQPYREGDMRAQFHKGDHLEASTAIHAEALLIARAAATGLSLAGADLYLTDFPCPTCAKLVAAAQFRRIFYLRGYAVLDGQRVLDAAGVEIFQIIPD